MNTALDDPPVETRTHLLRVKKEKDLLQKLVEKNKIKLGILTELSPQKIEKDLYGALTVSIFGSSFDVLKVLEYTYRWKVLSSDVMRVIEQILTEYRKKFDKITLDNKF